MSNCYVRNMSHFGRFRVSGQDAATLLHHLTTNHIKKLRVGEGCDAVLITNKARVLDWLQIWRDENGYTVLTSPNRRQMFAPHARKFVLYRQDVKIEDVTDRVGTFGLFGSGLSEALERIGCAAARDAPINAWSNFEVKGAHLAVSRSRRLPLNGVLLLSDDAEALQQLVDGLDVPVCDDATYNALRIEAGIPVAGLELTEDVNPWEANLDFAISLDKGCYNGQEIVARLNTYQKVKQRLMGLRLEEPLEPGTRIPLEFEGRAAGVVTSSAQSAKLGAIGLGYVRGDFQKDGQVLDMQSTPPQKAVVSALPFASS